ncbi:MAG: hypothetical protein ACRD3E_03420 [Terriglobales bacterium]
MRKYIPAIAILIACGSWACQGKIGRPGEAVTVQGCLQNSSGTFTLTDDAGRVYQLAGSTGDLAGHAGQQVLVRAEKVSSGQEPVAPPKANSAGVPNRLIVTSATFTTTTCGQGK